MTHTTVELETCDVDITSDRLDFWSKNPERKLMFSLNFEEFDELLESVARVEKFIDNPNPCVWVNLLTKPIANA